VQLDRRFTLAWPARVAPPRWGDSLRWRTRVTLWGEPDDKTGGEHIAVDRVGEPSRPRLTPIGQFESLLAGVRFAVLRLAVVSTSAICCAPESFRLFAMKVHRVGLRGSFQVPGHVSLFHVRLAPRSWPSVADLGRATAASLRPRTTEELATIVLDRWSSAREEGNLHGARVGT